MIWASWVILVVYLLSITVMIASIGKPRTKKDIITPGAAAFVFVISLGLLGCLNLIGWNWATIIVAADVVYTMGLGIVRIGRTPKVRTIPSALIWGTENLILCALIVIGSLL